MAVSRRSLIAVAVAGSGLLAIPFAAHADGTFEDMNVLDAWRAVERQCDFILQQVYWTSEAPAVTVKSPRTL